MCSAIAAVARLARSAGDWYAGGVFAGELCSIWRPFALLVTLGQSNGIWRVGVEDVFFRYGGVAGVGELRILILGVRRVEAGVVVEEALGLRAFAGCRTKPKPR